MNKIQLYKIDPFKQESLNQYNYYYNYIKNLYKKQIIKLALCCANLSYLDIKDNDFNLYSKKEAFNCLQLIKKYLKNDKSITSNQINLNQFNFINNYREKVLNDWGYRCIYSAITATAYSIMPGISIETPMSYTINCLLSLNIQINPKNRNLCEQYLQMLLTSNFLGE